MANTQLASVEPAPPIEYGKLNVIEKPQTTFFYRRLKDNFASQSSKDIDEITGRQENNIFSCYEQQAAKLDPRKFEQIGVSDGTTYVHFIKESGIRAGQLYPITKIREVLNGAFNAELEKAWGNFRRPVYHEGHFGGASEGTRNIEEYIATMK